jgi:hypothetical protein
MRVKDENAEAKSVARLSTFLFNLDLHDSVEVTLPVFWTAVSTYSLRHIVGNYLISVVSLARTEAENETGSQLDSMSLRNKWSTTKLPSREYALFLEHGHMEWRHLRDTHDRTANKLLPSSTQ